MRSLLFLIIVSLLSGEELFKELSFPKIETGKYNSYTTLRIPGGELVAQPGAPELPSFPLYIYLPKGARVLRVDTVSTVKSELRLPSPLKPYQPPQILSSPQPSKFIPPNPEIYNSLTPYPERIIEFIGQGNFRDSVVAEIIIHPIQYIPQTQRVIFYSKIDLRIEYKMGEPSVITPPAENGFEYLIITPTSFDTVFQRLAEWKTKKGIRAVVRRINDIVRFSKGRDTQEKIRNYLKVAYKDSGLKWLLLGGDVQFIPTRYAFAMACSSGIQTPRNEDWLPCDLYYSDLDGTWDANNNGIYGEVEDSVDLYPEIWVGRASVENILEAQTFVNKTLQYEKNPPLDYQNRLLFLAEILWTHPYTDAGKAKDMIDEKYIPEEIEPVKLYESKGNESSASVISAMNEGYAIINHDGHGWVNYMGTGEEGLLSEDIDSLTNSPRNSIIFSIGCWTNAFDFNDCIGEEFLKNPRGGGVAYIGNGSYGWGSPGNPGYGYSDRFDAEFYKKIYKDSIFEIGKALGMDKAHFIAFSRDRNVYRWHQYQLNLLGDPELNVWTDIPKNLQVLYPPSVPENGGTIRVIVKDGDRPLKGARVCLWKSTELYLRRNTSNNGEVVFSLPHLSGGKLQLTVTAHNFLPFEGEIEVTTEGPYLEYVDKRIDDDNKDGIPNPGEEVSFSLLFKNQGRESAKNIDLRLETKSPYIELIDNTSHLDELASQDSVWIDGFSFKIGGDCPDKEVIYFDLIVNGDNYSGEFHPSIIVGRPDLFIYKSEFMDSLIEPSDEVLIRVSLKNKGTGNGYNTWARLVSEDPKIVVEEDSVWFGTVLRGSVKDPSLFYKVRVSPDCPASYYSYLTLRIESEGYKFKDSLLLMVGRIGLAEDVEGGTEGWEMGGNHNLWHISNSHYHSPYHSFYCGAESTHTFLRNSNEWLLSPPFVIGETPILSFWRRFILPIYGTAGLYVEVYKDNEWDTLDFIGCGGALGKLEIRSEWAEERYELNYPVGETLRVRFTFVSDTTSPTEGFYIDDINVGKGLGIESKGLNLSEGRFLYTLGPNPAKEGVRIRFEIGDREYESSIDLTIYDVIGRKVKVLAKIQNPEPRAYIFSWDGRDNEGKRVPSGIYFSVLKVNNLILSKKIILIN